MRVSLAARTNKKRDNHGADAFAFGRYGPRRTRPPDDGASSDGRWPHHRDRRANGSERMTVVAGLVHPSPMWHRRGRAPRARILRLRVNAEMRPDETQPPSTRVGARRFRNRSDPTRKAPRPRRASVAFGTPPASPQAPNAGAKRKTSLLPFLVHQNEKLGAQEGQARPSRDIEMASLRPGPLVASPLLVLRLARLGGI